MKMQKKLTDLFISLINKVQEIEASIKPDQMEEYLESSHSDGIRYNLDVLKDERFQHTDYFKVILKGLCSQENLSEFRGEAVTLPGMLSETNSITLKPTEEINPKDRSYMVADNDAFCFWELFHDLARRYTNENLISLTVKTNSPDLEESEDAAWYKN
jgi:hypothetical protein